MLVKNSLATAVAIGLGASIGFSGSVNADAAFWPYIALGDSVTTVISVMNTSDENYASNGDPVRGTPANLHYQLYYKNVTGAATDNALPCFSVDTYLPTSEDDIQTVDMDNEFGTTTNGVLFNDPSVNNNWVGSGKDFSLGRGLGTARGYLVVNNDDDSTSSRNERSVTGEAFVFDWVAGAVWGYQASTSDDTDGDDFDFFGAVGTAMPNPTTVTIMPLAEITTAFFVTPLANDASFGDTQGMVPYAGNYYESTISFYTGDSYALFDRDENLVSGSVPVTVRCVGRVDATDMLSAGARQFVPYGGFGALVAQRTDYLTTKKSPYNPADADEDGEAAVEKLEYNSGGTFNGEPIVGTFNNGFRLLAPAHDWVRVPDTIVTTP